MGGCTSKPKTTEYEGLMDPHAKGYDNLGRKSMDTDKGSVEAAPQSEDTGLKAIGRSNSAQKSSKRSLQNLFFKQQERGDENLVDNNDIALRDALREIGDPMKQTIGGLNAETNPVRAEEENKSTPKENDKFLGSGEETAVTESPGKAEEGTKPVLKNAQEKPAPAIASAVPFKESAADDQSLLSSKHAEEVDKECAPASETEVQEKNGRIDSEPRELLQETVVSSETQLPSQDPPLPAEKSAEQGKASDLGVEVVKPVDSGQIKKETSCSGTITLSHAPEVARVIEVTHPAAGSAGSLEMKADVFDELKVVAPEELPYEGGSQAAESGDVGHVQQNIEGKSSKTAIVIEESDLAHEETEHATSREAEASASSVESREVVGIASVSHAEDGTETLGTNEPFAVESLDSGAATTESSAITESDGKAAPTGECDKEDQICLVPPAVTDTPEASRTESCQLADKRREDEELAEIFPAGEESLPVDYTTIAETESAVQDEAINQISTVDELQPGLAPNENPVGSLISQAEDPPFPSVEDVESDITACELNRPQSPESSIEETSHTLAETEFDSKVASMEGTGSQLSPKVESDIAEPQANSVDCEPALSQESMNPEQGGRASSPELGESEPSARQEVIGSGDIQGLQQSDAPSTQEGSNLCDQLPFTADQVVEAHQGFQMDSSHLIGFEEQHQAISKSKEGLDVTAQKVLSPEMESGEVTENGIRVKPISDEDVPEKDVASSDIDQVLEKLASEFERQASAEMGGKVRQEPSAILAPSK